MLICPSCRIEFIEQRDGKFCCANCGWLEPIQEGGYRPAQPPGERQPEPEIDNVIFEVDDMAKKLEQEKPDDQSDQVQEEPKRSSKKRKDDRPGIMITFDDEE